MSTMYAMSDHHVLTDTEVEQQHAFAGFLVMLGVLTPVKNLEPGHEGEEGLSTTDDDGYATGNVVLVRYPDGHEETALDVPPDFPV